MQNINLIFVLQPTIVISIASALLIYWYLKRRFHLMVLVYSLVAYAVAMALKIAFQAVTATPVVGYFGAQSIGTGLYFGLQTVFFEIGIAFVVAWFVVSRGALHEKDAEAYGSGLAFWENAGLLGILPIINLIAYHSILSGNTSLSQTLYEQLMASAPTLFAPTSEAIGLLALGILERVSSILIHFAWGYLCLMAAVYHRKRLFLIALPMGLVDFLVPFAQSSIVAFEVIFVVISVLSVIVAWYATRAVIKKQSCRNPNT